jgi:hypothetical protein
MHNLGHQATQNCSMLLLRPNAQHFTLAYTLMSTFSVVIRNHDSKNNNDNDITIAYYGADTVLDAVYL